MAGAAGEVEAVRRHVHVEVVARVLQRGVEVTVLDRITAATQEMAGAAGVATGLAHLARHLAEVGGLDDAAGVGRKLHVLVGRMSGQPGDLAVGAGGVVANQAIDVFLRTEVEAVVLPAVAHVTGGAELVVGGYGRAEIVDDVLLAQALLGGRVEEFPGPVLALVHLLGGLGMAAQAGLGNLGTGFEVLLQRFEGTMIGGRFRLRHACGRRGLHRACLDRGAEQAGRQQGGCYGFEHDASNAPNPLRARWTAISSHHHRQLRPAHHQLWRAGSSAAPACWDRRRGISSGLAPPGS